MDELQINVMSGGPRIRSVRTQSRNDTFLRFRNVTFWTLFLIASSDRVRHHCRKPLHYNSLQWWAHLDSNQGPTDYESARDVRGYWSFAEHLCF